jgi:hypothetical protein
LTKLTGPNILTEVADAEAEAEEVRRAADVETTFM